MLRFFLKILTCFHKTIAAMANVHQCKYMTLSRTHLPVFPCSFKKHFKRLLQFPTKVSTLHFVCSSSSCSSYNKRMVKKCSLPLHQESGQKPGKPGKARPGQACWAFGRAYQKSTAWKSQSSPAKAGLLWPPRQPNLGKPGLGRTFGATMATKARLSRACKFHARISWLSWPVTY